MSNGKVSPASLVQASTNTRRRNRVNGALNVISRLSERNNENPTLTREDRAAIGILQTTTKLRKARCLSV